MVCSYWYYIIFHYVKCTIVMRLFKVVVRFVNQDDFEIRFSSDDEAYSYFEHLVKFELDGLLHSVWCISLSCGKKTLRHYSNYLNVKH